MAGYIETMANADKFKQTFNNEAQVNAAKAKALDGIVAQNNQAQADAAKQAELADAAKIGAQQGMIAGHQQGMQTGEQVALSKLLQTLNLGRKA